MGKYTLLVFFVVLTFIIQIGISFYYASEIVNQNSLFHQSQLQLSLLTQKNQQLRYQYGQITSIEYLQEHLPPGLTPINKTIDLSHE